MQSEEYAAGRIALISSGETALAGGRVFESLARTLPAPLHIAVLETPAGFELNSARVAGRVADFLAVRLQNYQPQIKTIPARARGGPFSPDDPTVTASLLDADLIFLGPGSPTYAVRQLRNSLVWRRLRALQRTGAALALASAAVIAIGAWALPVYEIYKAGHDLHWQPGLDFFGLYGLELVFVPHWNNSEGGAELDTGRCFMGRSRFETLRAMLPASATIIGLDEHTALLIELQDGVAQVMGAGVVTVLRGGDERVYSAGDRFALTELGPFAWPIDRDDLPDEIWAEALARRTAGQREPVAPAALLDLLNRRQTARDRQDWAAADALRSQIEALGWQVQDTAAGPRYEPL